MKKFLILGLLFSSCAFADTCHLEQVGGGDWRIVCEGSGLVYNYVDITNDVYVVADCEQLKQSLLYTAYALSQDTSADISDELQSILASADTIRQQYGLDSLASDIVGSVDDINAQLTIFHRKMTDTTFDGYGSLAKSINDINCGSCPTNGASGGGSGGSCCDVDFTDIINRLIVADQQRAAISNQIVRISNYLGVVTNQLAYNNFLLEHGFQNTTNLLYYGLYSTEDDVFPYQRYWFYNQQGKWSHSFSQYPSEEPYSLSSIFLNFGFSIMEGITSLNNFNHSLVDPSFQNLTNTVGSISKGVSFITNQLAGLRSDINPVHSLSQWTGGSIYDYLTNQYLNAINASPSNWHSRVETLLAALVFQGSSQSSPEQDLEDETQDGIDDVTSRQSELESAFDSEENITFLDLENFETFEMPDIEVSDDQLPDSLVITIGALTWFDDTYAEQDITIDLTNNDLRDFLTIVRSLFRVMWWGAVLLFVWWLFKWFVRFLKWVWSAIKGIDFGA